MSTFGVAKSTCRQAASASGPSGQCGASAASKVSASAAMRRTSEMPPACATSGCTTPTPACSTGRKSHREYSRSPVAIGVLEPRRRAGRGRRGCCRAAPAPRRTAGGTARAGAAAGARPAPTRGRGSRWPDRAPGRALRGRRPPAAGCRPCRPALGRWASSPARVHLHRGQPGRHLGGDRVGDLAGVVAADPAVDADAVADRAAEQAVDRARRAPCRRGPTAPGRYRRRPTTAPGRPR